MEDGYGVTVCLILARMCGSGSEWAGWAFREDFRRCDELTVLGGQKRLAVYVELVVRGPYGVAEGSSVALDLSLCPADSPGHPVARTRVSARVYAGAVLETVRGYMEFDTDACDLSLKYILTVSGPDGATLGSRECRFYSYPLIRRLPTRWFEGVRGRYAVRRGWSGDVAEIEFVVRCVIDPSLIPGAPPLDIRLHRDDEEDDYDEARCHAELPTDGSPALVYRATFAISRSWRGGYAEVCCLGYPFAEMAVDGAGSGSSGWVEAPTLARRHFYDYTTSKK